MDGKQSNYTYLMWEIDTTGRYLLDEMCHLSAQHQDSSFDEYIMPHRNISYPYSRKFHLFTVSIGKYRSLRRSSYGMVIKSNTEVVTLKNFLKWLSQRSNTPIILMCYEPYEYSSFILLQALKKYELFDEFKSLVFGFADVYSLVKKKCKKSVSSMSLRTLAKIFLNKNNLKCLDSSCRAGLVNEILLHLFEDSDNPTQKMEQEMFHYISPVEEVDKRLCGKLVKRRIQSSLKPIFLPYFKELNTRRRALVLRNLLIYKSSPSIDFNVLKTMWSKGPDAFKEDMFKHIVAADKDVLDLIGVISYHFECDSKPDLKKFSLHGIESSMKTLQID